jgi:hypothetical protein
MTLTSVALAFAIVALLLGGTLYLILEELK